MKRLLTTLLLAMVLIPLSARQYKIHFWQENGTSHDSEIIGMKGSNWVLEVNGSDFNNWGVAGNNGYVYLLPFTEENGNWNNWYKLDGSSEFTNSGDSYTFYKDKSDNSGLKLPSDYANKIFTFTLSSADQNGSNITITVTWRDKVSTSSVYLLGTINNWADNTTQLTADGSEYKLELAKAQVEDALWQGDFYFRFIENMSNSDKYAVVPQTDQTKLTVGAGYNTNTYATTNIYGDSKKDYYWKFTPTGANNYTIYFKNVNGSRQVRVVDDNPKLYLHSNLGGNHWSGVTDYALTYNAASGFYERTFTEAEINSASDGDMRFRIYDNNESWGPQVNTYVFDNEGSEAYTSTTAGGTNNYFSIPKDFFSAKIEAKPVTGGVIVNVTLVYNASYYWVSPQITNGEKWEYFKMVPSRNRSRTGGGEGASDGKISKKYYTFTIKNEDIVTWKTKSKITDGTKIQWYIVREDDGLFFRPTGNDPNPTSSANSLSYNSVTDNGVGYRNYMNDYHTTDATRSGYFEFNKGYSDTSNSDNALSYTFMINSENGNVFFDYTRNPAATDINYYLIGNFTSAKGTVDIDISNNVLKMDKYVYADSVVYKVEVKKPDEGWGDLYIDVRQGNDTNWDNVLRPLISLGNNLDGRAMHGALTTAKSEQSLNPEASNNYQSYTFSFNATTRTYKLEFNMPDATLSPGYENSNVEFDNSWGETISVNYSDATQYATAATKCYISAGSSSAIELDETTAKERSSFSSFNLTYDGTYIYMDGTRVADGNTVYIKIRGVDGNNVKGEIHTYQYTFNAKMSFEPKGGLFINSSKIKIEGGVPPYRYEVWTYGTTEQGGETVIDTNNGTKITDGTFDNVAYDANDRYYRISTPGFLKIIDAQGLEANNDVIGGGFDFTYSTSENYKTALTSTETKPNGDDYYRVMPTDYTWKVGKTWERLDPIAGNQEESWQVTSGKHWSGDPNIFYLHMRMNEAYQTVTDLPAGTYTVQAIVRGGGVPVYLKLNDTQVASIRLTSDGPDAKTTINKFGRSEQLVEMSSDNEKRGWHKLEGTVTLATAGNLKIAVRTDYSGTGGSVDLADVYLLKDANSDGNYWTTAPTSETDTEYDMSNRSKYNAFSFFDRGANLNSIIMADQKTVIGMSEDNEPYLTGAEKGARRHPCNVVTSSDGGTTWHTPMLALTDYASVIVGSENKYGGNPLVSQHAYGTSFAYTADKFSYDRATSAKMMSTMLPFPLTRSQIESMLGDGVKTYIYGDANKTTYKVTFSETSGELAANTPFFFRPVEAKPSMVLNQPVSVQATPAAAALAEGIVGTYKHISNVGSTYTDFIPYFYQDNFFVWATNDANAKPFRVIFLLHKGGNNARMLNAIFVDDTTTGIDGITENIQQNAPVYSIDGKLVSSDGDTSRLSKGVYVKAGKKFIIK